MPCATATIACAPRPISTRIRSTPHGGSREPQVPTTRCRATRIRRMPHGGSREPLTVTGHYGTSTATGRYATSTSYPEHAARCAGAATRRADHVEQGVNLQEAPGRDLVGTYFRVSTYR